MSPPAGLSLRRSKHDASKLEVCLSGSDWLLTQRLEVRVALLRDTPAPGMLGGAARNSQASNCLLFWRELLMRQQC